MPTPTKGARLGGSPSHERLILANLATSLFEHGRVKTTEAKAKRLRPYAERLITKAKRGDLHNRREIMKVIRDKDVVHKLMAEIGPFYASRNGGYTRITKTMPRKGDNAKMAVIELVAERLATEEAEAARKTTFAKDQPAAADQVAEEPAADVNAEAGTEKASTTEEGTTEQEAAEASADEGAGSEAGSDDAEADTDGKKDES